MLLSDGASGISATPSSRVRGLDFAARSPLYAASSFLAAPHNFVFATSAVQVALSSPLNELSCEAVSIWTAAAECVGPESARSAAPTSCALT